ncbi:hypothetical protein ACFP81_02610 [Deinococcus lacus]|uniref:Lipoprotein n=1 Tax=Deinococcus lacus TaxID=392561 RepID=A0ABW1Y9Q1_9DEIO
MKKLLVAGLLMMAGAAAAQESAQDYYGILREMMGDGYTEALKPQTGVLASGERRLIKLTFTQPGEYMGLAACDVGCADMDLYLFDEQGNLVTTDEEDDSFPILDFEVGKSKTYYAEVAMFDCDEEEGCNYMVGFYRSED